MAKNYLIKYQACVPEDTVRRYFSKSHGLKDSKIRHRIFTKNLLDLCRATRH